MRAKYLIIFVVVVVVVGLGITKAYELFKPKDTQCGTMHTPTSQQPGNPQTPTDYFNLGDYDYETGDCIKAIADYTKAIELDQNSSRAYNNRAYTYMRMRDYSDALSDLNKAIELDPQYVTALANRGDIYNYYLINRPKALVDYKQVLSLNPNGDIRKTVCGHKAMAETNNMIPFALLKTMGNPNCK